MATLNPATLKALMVPVWGMGLAVEQVVLLVEMGLICVGDFMVAAGKLPIAALPSASKFGHSPFTVEVRLSIPRGENAIEVIRSALPKAKVDYGLHRIIDRVRYVCMTCVKCGGECISPASAPTAYCGACIPGAEHSPTKDKPKGRPDPAAKARKRFHGGHRADT